jgi:hypothetical protein
MSVELKNIWVETDIPKWPRALPVFKVKNASLESRKKALDVFREILKLGDDALIIEEEESIHFVNEHVEIQYYRPSGALWVHDSKADSKFKDERRPWKVIETEDPESKNDILLVLDKKEQEKLAEQTKTMLQKAELLVEEAYFAGVELDQVARLDKEGNEVERFAGEANVRFLYQLGGIPVDGPGGKTYAYFNPDEDAYEFTGLYHAWREIEGETDIKMQSFEETLERSIKRDQELALHLKKAESSIKISATELIYFTMPPFKYQTWVFPALHVVGSVIPNNEKDTAFGFAKFYNAGPIEAYSRAGIVAGYLLSNL